MDKIKKQVIIFLDVIKLKNVFISYSWENEGHKKLVKKIGELLEEDGINVSIDQWDLRPGDELALYMEKAIQESDYTLIICSAGYKKKADERIGGSGYEAKLITTSLSMDQHIKKFIPIYIGGEWEEVAPVFIQGNMYVDFSQPIGSRTFEENYTDLLTTIFKVRRRRNQKVDTKARIAKRIDVGVEEIEFEEESKGIRIERIVTDEVTIPKNDGTKGSALYSIPFTLNRKPDSTWVNIFVQCWNRPPRFTSMHRPGIVKVLSDKIILDGTTIEEVKSYHRDTLILAVSEANKKYNDYMEKKEREGANRIKNQQEHFDNVHKHVSEIDFD